MTERIIKYEASAGSGKTYRLTMAYLKRVFSIFTLLRTRGARPVGEDSPSRWIASILAITFTNKAAGEMKQRVLGSLKRFSTLASGRFVPPEERASLTDLAGEFALDVEELSRLSTWILDVIISHYGDFNIKTIDSLMNAVVQVISPDLDLPADFEVVIDGGESVREAARRFLEERCLRDWQGVEPVLTDIKNSGLLTGWYLEDQVIERLLHFFFLLQNRETWPEAPSAEEPEAGISSWRDFRNSLEHLIEVCSEEPLEGGVNRHLKRNVVNRTFLEEAKAAVAETRNFPRIEGLIVRAFFSKESGREHLKRDAPEAFARRWEHAFLPVREALSRLVLRMSRERVLHFSRFFSGFMDFWEGDRHTLLVTEFSRTIRNKLLEWERTYLPYIYLKLSDRYRHFLFDEFQDTSELQFKALLPIIEEVLSSTETSSLFLVGDRKQAIYRWRGGNAELMEESRLRDELSELAWLSPASFTRRLDINWRSREAIVDFNNRFWNSENLEVMLKRISASDHLIETVRTNFATAFQSRPPEVGVATGLVSISSPVSDDGAGDSRGISTEMVYLRCGDIVKALVSKGYRGGDIAVLTRRNVEARQVVHLFNGMDIPTISDESMFLSASPHILEIISLFRFLEYPADNLHFYSFIRGEIFSKVTEDGFAEEMRGVDWDALGDGRTHAVLYPVFRKHFPSLWKTILYPLLAQVGFSPPYDIFADITQRFRLYEHFPEAAQFFLTLATLLHDLEQEGVHSLSTFLREWEALMQGKRQYAIQVTGEASRVRVLTMHKAKGLEFPVVILPLIDQQPHPAEAWYWREGEFLYIKKDYARMNAELRRLYVDEIEKGFIDELNLLYVAFTRARDALFIPMPFHPPPKRAKEADPFRRFTHFPQLVSNHPLVAQGLAATEAPAAGWWEFSLGTLPDPPPGSGEAETDLPVRSKDLLTAQWQRDFLVFAPSQPRWTEDDGAIRRGENIHRALASIEWLESIESVSAVVGPVLKGEGVGEEDTDAILGFLVRPDVFPFFHTNAAVHTERELVVREGSDVVYRRVDRLVVGKEEVFVVEYKTGSNRDASHAEQVIGYGRIVQLLYPEQRIRCFLLYIDRGEVEEIPC